MTERPADDPELAALYTRAHSLAAGGRRCILGIAGPPAAGKSTLAAWLADRLNTTGDTTVSAQRAVVVPMDGFHLADAELRRLGCLGRKGAPDTFDAAGYRALLDRIRTQADDVIYAPEFDRDFAQPVAGAIPIPRTVPLVVTEGNYLLHDGPGWCGVRPLLDEVWYCDTASDARLERLVDRHVRSGLDADTARTRAEAVDQVNAALIERTRFLADVQVAVGAGLSPREDG